MQTCGEGKEEINTWAKTGMTVEPGRWIFRKSLYYSCICPKIEIISK
jgi:hypothetical protein